MPILEKDIRFLDHGLNQKNSERMSASQDGYTLIREGNGSYPPIADYTIVSVGVGVSDRRIGIQFLQGRVLKREERNPKDLR